MIKVSKLADYAVVILAALSAKAGAASAAELSAKTGLSTSTVAKVLKLLAKANIVSGARGAAGGYQMAIEPAQLSIAQIVTAVDGPVQVTECSSAHSTCANNTYCSMQGRWGRVNRALISALNTVMLTDMMQPVSPGKAA